MSMSDIPQFKMSIHRIIMLISALFRFLQTFLGLGMKATVPIPLPSPKDEYIEKCKQMFLLTFREETEEGDEKEEEKTTENKATVNYSSNVDLVFRDAKMLADVLQEPNNELEKKWRTRILIENTPRGNVIMFYDAYKRAFSYYCDQAVMPYDIMNAVAMKYVITYRCRDFFVDSSVLASVTSTSTSISTAKPEDGEPEPSKEKTNKITVDKQAFVKFKTYNTATKKAGVSKEDDKTINCFLHLGASRNWTPIMKKAKANPINGFKTDMIPGNKKLSYADYKKMTQQT